MLKIIKYLSKNYIEVRPLWYPNHLQKKYKNCQTYKLDNVNNIYLKYSFLISSIKSFILSLLSSFNLFNLSYSNFKSDFNIINPNEKISDYIESIYLLSFKIINLNSGDI